MNKIIAIHKTKPIILCWVKNHIEIKRGDRTESNLRKGHRQKFKNPRHRSKIICERLHQRKIAIIWEKAIHKNLFEIMPVRKDMYLNQVETEKRE